MAEPSPGSDRGLRRHMVSSVGATGALYAVHVIVLFGVSLLLARVLGPAELGVYAYVLAILNILAVFARLGFNLLLVRETAKAQATADWPYMRGLWTWVAQIVGIAGVLLTCGIWLYLAIFGHTLPDDRRNVLYAGLAISALVGIGNMLNGALRGLQRVAAALTPELLVRPIGQITLLAAVLAVYGSGALGAVEAMWLNTLSTLFACLVAAVLLWRLAPAQVFERGPVRRDPRAWVLAAMPMAASAGLIQVYDQSAVIALGTFSSDAETGIFRVVVQIAHIGNFAALPFFMVATPMYSRLHSKGDRLGLQRLVTATARGASGVIFALLVGAVLLGEWFLGFAFGEAYEVGYTALLVLGVGYFLASLCGPAPDLLQMTGHERAHTVCMVVSVVIIVSLCLALVPSFGGLGAAFSFAISLVVARVAMMLIARSRLGIDTTPLGFFSRV